MAGLSRGNQIFADTNVIIEAHRVKCFNAVASAFSIETTEECVAECVTGDFTQPGYVPVDAQTVRERTIVHQVTKAQMAAAALRSMSFRQLDRGEQEVLAVALAAPGPWFVSTADKSALRTTQELGFLDRTVSLEEIAALVGMNCTFKGAYTRKFLESVRADIFLDDF